jgi:hypothetical protein
LRRYVLVTAVIFAIVAVAHALRLIMPWSLVVAGWEAPPWASVAGVAVAGGLCAWAFRLLRKQ